MKSFCMVLNDPSGDHEVIVNEDNITNLINTFQGWVTVGIEIFRCPDGGIIRKAFDHRPAAGFIEFAISIFNRMDEAGIEHLEDIDDLVSPG